MLYIYLFIGVEWVLQGRLVNILILTKKDLNFLYKIKENNHG